MTARALCADTGVMAGADLLERLREAHGRAQMRGWDFSVLEGRLVSEEPPWDFDADCLEALATASRVLDLGTGGGERILRLWSKLGEDARPQLTATEAWEPNVPVARENLAAIGVQVVEYDADTQDPLPFEDGSCDLVMCRHESLDAAEVARVLAPGGVLLCQQVDGRDAQELRQWFGGQAQYPNVRLDAEREAVARAGLVVDVTEEWSGAMEFADVEALVTYMGLVPWDVPDFRVDDHAQTLRELDRKAQLRVTQRRYRLYAHLPQR
jgi:SAM-dependent methyltransferase